MTEGMFNNFTFNGTYRNNRISITNGVLPLEETKNWLDVFQSEVNRLTESKHLQFALEIWNPDAPEGVTSSNPDITIHQKDFLPYLDTGLYWNREELKFRVHLKFNKQLKYLNRSSTHPSNVFKAVPNSIIKRLAQLKSITTIKRNQIIGELYPGHVEALRHAGLNPKKSVHR